MSKICCPKCGRFTLDKLAGDDDGDMWGCRSCKQLAAITLFETEYHFLVEDGPRPIFDQAAAMVDANGKCSDKGVSL